jgi:hypothetical protein
MTGGDRNGDDENGIEEIVYNLKYLKFRKYE